MGSQSVGLGYGRPRPDLGSGSLPIVSSEAEQPHATAIAYDSIELRRVIGVLLL